MIEKGNNILNEPGTEGAAVGQKRDLMLLPNMFLPI